MSPLKVVKILKSPTTIVHIVQYFVLVGPPITHFYWTWMLVSIYQQKSGTIIATPRPNLNSTRYDILQIFFEEQVVYFY